MVIWWSRGDLNPKLQYPGQIKASAHCARNLDLLDCSQCARVYEPFESCQAWHSPIVKAVLHALASRAIRRRLGLGCVEAKRSLGLKLPMI